MSNKFTVTILFVGILLLAVFFRFYGVNWDSNQHLHPDERFLTMVANGIDWPKNFQEYLDTDTSPLNPHNRNYGFFVYGTFPVFLTKWVAESFNWGDYNELTIVGRILSAIFDLGTVILVFFISKQLLNKTKDQRLKTNSLFPLIAMFFYTVSVLPIQLSHFYAVDTYLTFFLTLSFFLSVKLLISSFLPSRRKYQILTIKYFIIPALLGVSFGLALASKITAVLFLPIIILFLLFKSLQIAKNYKKTKNIFYFLYIFLLFTIYSLLFTYITLRLAQPYLFTDSNFFNLSLNQKVIDNWKELRSFEGPDTWFPPAIQWINNKPYIDPINNFILWGVGLPLGLLSLTAVMYQVIRLVYYVLKKKIFLILNTYYLILFLILLWILLLFSYQGMQFSKNMRYFLPIYPFFAILSANFLHEISQYINNKSNLKIGLLGYWVIGLLVIIYPLSFLSIYAHPHSRIAASQWIYQNIPAGSQLAIEHWDDGLPLSLPQQGFVHEKYIHVEFPLYGQDTPEKWQDMIDRLQKVDYILLTSNRLYGSIMTVPEKFPITYRYYQALFDGSLGFSKVAEFTSRPNLPIPFIKLCLTPPLAHYGFIAKKTQECPLPGINFADDYADESFTVYDHPKVIILKKILLNQSLLNQYLQKSQSQYLTQ